MNETIEDKIANLSHGQQQELLGALDGRELSTLSQGRITSWSLIPFKGGTLIGDITEHTDRSMVRADMQTTAVLFIDRREDGFAVTRNTVYHLDGAEVTVG